MTQLCTCCPAGHHVACGSSNGKMAIHEFSGKCKKVLEEKPHDAEITRLEFVYRVII